MGGISCLQGSLNPWLSLVKSWLAKCALLFIVLNIFWLRPGTVLLTELTQAMWWLPSKSSLTVETSFVLCAVQYSSAIWFWGQRSWCSVGLVFLDLLDILFSSWFLYLYICTTLYSLVSDYGDGMGVGQGVWSCFIEILEIGSNQSSLQSEYGRWSGSRGSVYY